jgi:hypothetical protein
MAQFAKRSARPLMRETYQVAADNWSRLCSQMDDYAMAGNRAGVTRILNRLHYSVEHLRERHAIDGREAFPR